MTGRTGDVDVAVIGAGAAGVGVARGLAGHGLSVQVLEASQRVGGRGWTQDLAGMPLDMGCGWLHSAEHNAWRQIAGTEGWEVDRRAAAWDKPQPHPRFTASEQQDAHAAYDAWHERLMTAPPTSDRASDALEPGSPWNGYLQAMSGYISGAPLESISAADYNAYERAATQINWRLPRGYGSLIAASMPAGVTVRLATPVQSVAFERGAVVLHTPSGDLRARAVVYTGSTHVLSTGLIRLPSALDAWCHAASMLPLGCDEKLFLRIHGDVDIPTEKALIANPRDADSPVFYLRPLDRPVIEVFVGSGSAASVTTDGPAAAFDHLMACLADLLGTQAARHIRPLASSAWRATTWVGGSYSHALPGQAAQRGVLAAPFEGRLFFAGEATHVDAFSTAHGALESGLRAAGEVLAAISPHNGRP